VTDARSINRDDNTGGLPGTGPIDLDDAGILAATDPSDFLGSVEQFPVQVEEAWKLGVEAGDLPEGEGVSALAILGVGGSGISGDAVRGVLGARSRLPVHTLRGSDLPAWVGRNTLVFAVSYSGNTEETLHLFEQARGRGARVVVLTSGGALGECAGNAGAAVVRLPEGLQPRAALGYLTIPILVVLERLGLGPQVADELAGTIALLQRRAAGYGRSSPTRDNAAKRLALSVVGKLPWVYGSEGLSEVAAYRWKCQMNECAKVPCSSSFFPELTHNEVVGWSGLRQLTRTNGALVVLRHDGESSAMARRIDATLRLVRGSFAFATEIWAEAAEGSTELSRFLDLTYLGDFTSTYLGIAAGVDPAPVEPIERLKRELAATAGGGPGAGSLEALDDADELQPTVRKVDTGSV
jgi:glucose/mannose-6-phosphate isomerase